MPADLGRGPRGGPGPRAGWGFRIGRGRWLVAGLALLASGWALAVVVAGDLSISIAGVAIRSRDPIRPLAAAFVAAAAFVLLSGRARLRDDVARVAPCVRPSSLAILLAVVLAGVGFSANSTTAGGSDAFSYVMQADSWRHGDLQDPRAARLPRAVAPPRRDVHAGPGYRPAIDGAAIVPVTAPGLSLLMASLAVMAGHCAMFWIGPLSGGLLVVATFFIGRRMVSDEGGLAASWIVATSPTVLLLFKAPMSDVPCAAAWALSIALLLRGSTRAAMAAGAAAAIAIAIRPNLVPIAAVLGAWSLWHAIRSNAVGTTRFAPVVAFALGALPGCLLVAWYNNALYGSPLASGYGDLEALFSARYVPTNLSRYGGWLIETQSPLAVLGIAALVPWSRGWLARIWPTPDARRAALLLLGVWLVVWLFYLPYTPFDAWWFLRFLLPSWPAVAVGTAALGLAAAAGRGRWGRLVACVVLLGVGVQGLVVAARKDVFPVGEGERRYATVAELVAQVTEPSSVIVTGLHAGSIGYYAGRVPVRFDLLDPAWLDRAVDWLAQEGRHPYILLEDWELPAFERRFGAERLGRLALDPVLVYQAYRIPGTIYLFDPLRPRGPTARPAPIPDPQPRCVEKGTGTFLRFP